MGAMPRDQDYVVVYWENGDPATQYNLRRGYEDSVIFCAPANRGTTVPRCYPSLNS
jgi:hypothetical protein